MTRLSRLRRVKQTGCFVTRKKKKKRLFNSDHTGTVKVFVGVKWETFGTGSRDTKLQPAEGKKFSSIVERNTLYKLITRSLYPASVAPLASPLTAALISICSQARRFEQRRSKRPISDLDNSIRRPIIESIRAYPAPRSDTVLAEDSSGSILETSSKENVPRCFSLCLEIFSRGRETRPGLNSPVLPPRAGSFAFLHVDYVRPPKRSRFLLVLPGHGSPGCLF